MISRERRETTGRNSEANTGAAIILRFYQNVTEPVGVYHKVKQGPALLKSLLVLRGSYWHFSQPSWISLDLSSL